MLGIKKKIKLTDDERRIIFYALNDFRTESLKEGKYVDIINEAMCKVKPKMKLEKGILGVTINALVNIKEKVETENYDTSTIENLILKLYEVYQNLK